MTMATSRTDSSAADTATLSAVADKDDMNADDPLSSEGEGCEEQEEGSGSGSESDDEEGGRLLKATLEARQAARAAGDHPLQNSFRAAAAQLLEKYGTASKQKSRKEEGKASEKVGKGISEKDDVSAGEEEESGDDSSMLEDSEADQSADSDEEQDSGSTSGEEDEDQDLQEPVPQDPASSLAVEAQAKRQLSERQSAHAEAQSSGQQHAGAQQGAALDGPDDIPYTIAAPATYAVFAQLVKDQPPGKLRLIVQRIRACNAIALATDNRRKLQASCAPLRMWNHPRSFRVW